VYRMYRWTDKTWQKNAWQGYTAVTGNGVDIHWLTDVS
jgi:hypothetical protein